MRLRETGSAALVKAWLEGNWDGIDGAFFSEFSEEKHVLRGLFRFPEHWTVFRAMDWGYAAPFSIGWYCVSDGSLPGIERGALVKFKEWYGWNGKPNVGLRLANPLIAEGILKREKQWSISPRYGVADPSIFNIQGGPSISEQFVVGGVSFFKADNSREAGWSQMRRRLAAEPSLLLFHEDCENTIRTIPVAQHDEKRPEDLDTDSEDHALDETRYAIMSRPSIRDAKKPDTRLSFDNARAMPTINELIAKSRSRRLAETSPL
jgi:hypothetical protein